MARLVFIIVGALLVNNFGADGEPDLLSKFSYTTKKFTYGMLQYLINKDPTKSYTVSPIPVLCALGQLTANFSCPNDKSICNAMKLLNTTDGDEITETFTMLKKLIDNDDSFGKAACKVYSDKCKCFTEEFKSNLKGICGGVTSNIDFKDGSKAAEMVNKWLVREHPDISVEGAKSEMFKKKGVLFAFSWDYPYNFNHINNPTGLRPIEFTQNDGDTFQVPAVYGKAYIRYGENEELDATFTSVSLDYGDDQYEVIALPNNPDNLIELIDTLLSDIQLFDEIIDSLEPMCVNLTYLIGEVHDVVNVPSEYLRDQGIPLKNYGGILENDNCDTDVIEMLQKIDLTAIDVEQRECIDSPKCRDVDDVIDVAVDRPGLYMIMSKSLGGPLGGGLFFSNIISGRTSK